MLICYKRYSAVAVISTDRRHRGVFRRNKYLLFFALRGGRLNHRPHYNNNDDNDSGDGDAGSGNTTTNAYVVEATNNETSPWTRS